MENGLPAILYAFRPRPVAAAAVAADTSPPAHPSSAMDPSEGDDATDLRISFDESMFGHGIEARLVSVDEGSREFAWTVAENVDLDEVVWFGNSSGQEVVIARWAFGSVSGKGDAITDFRSNGASLNLQSPDVRALLGTAMSIRLTWEARPASGYSQSPGFSVIDADHRQQAVDSLSRVGDRAVESVTPPLTAARTMPSSRPPGTAVTPAGRETAAGDDNQDQDTTRRTRATVAPTSHTPTGQAHVSGGLGSDPAPGGSRHNGGLSPGAIAGIGVGAGVLVVLLLAGLVWFCLVRRRRRVTVQQGSASCRGAGGDVPCCRACCGTSL